MAKAAKTLPPQDPLTAGRRALHKRRNAAQDRRDALSLLGRVVVLAAAAWVLFTQVFLLTQASGNSMFPAVKDGDLLIGTHRRQRICAGGVHELPVLRVSRCFRFFVMVLPAGDGHRGAGRVHRAGSRAEQCVEHGGFADVRIADEYDAAGHFVVADSIIAGVAVRAVIRGHSHTAIAMPATIVLWTAAITTS